MAYDPAQLDGALAPEERRSDGWYSAITGIGTTSYDKRLGAGYDVDTVDKTVAENLWRGDDIGARIVEAWPDDMFREGYEFEPAEQDAALSDLVTDRWDSEDLDVLESLQRVYEYARAYGGGAILLGVNDGQTTDQPLDMERVISFDFLTTLEPDELTPHLYYTDPMLGKFGEVSHWLINPISNGGISLHHQQTIVHESRLIIQQGNRVSRRQVGVNSGFGDSVFTRVWSVLRDFNMSWSSVGVLLNDFSQSVIKVKGLAEAIGTDNDEFVQARLKAMELTRSVCRAVIIDAEEEYQRHQTPVTGMSDLLDRFNQRLATAVDMPLTRLMGISPGGLNATGESDITLYYDRVKAKQVRSVLPKLKRITRLILAAEKMQAKQWSVEPRALHQEKKETVITRRKTQAETDQIYINAGVLHPDEVAVQRFGGREYSHETTIDQTARDVIDANEADIEAKAEELAKAKLAEMQAAPLPGGIPPQEPPA